MIRYIYIIIGIIITCILVGVANIVDASAAMTIMIVIIALEGWVSCHSAYITTNHGSINKFLGP